MLQVELKPLFARLNPYTRRALEDAAGLCLTRGHYEIAIEHFLLKLLDDPRSDVPLMLAHFGIDTARLAAALEAQLAKLKNGSATRPVFSPRLADWLQDAWLAASITLGQTHIRGGALLIALRSHARDYIAGSAYDGLLRAIHADAASADFAALTERSNEELPDAEPNEHVAPLVGGTTGGAPDDSPVARFCQDFTASARAGKIDPVFGRDAEIRQIIDILARRRKNNPICVGDPGVGKTAVVEALALRIAQGDVPAFLADVRVLALDLGLLEAGASIKGEFENRLRGVIDELKTSATPSILFIDEAHMLIGAGGPAGGSDAANLLKPALARGELRTIAATTWAEYKKYFEKDPALARRFQLVRLDEPDVPVTMQILRGLKDSYEAEHGVAIRDDALVAAAELSSRYITGRHLPDKAVDLIDMAAARVKIGLDVKPYAIESTERALAGIRRERTALERDAKYGQDTHTARLAEIQVCEAQKTEELNRLHARWALERAVAQPVFDLRARVAEATATACEPDLLTELAAAQSALERCQGDAPLLFTEVTPEVVARVVSDWTGIPLGRLKRDGAAAMLGLADTLKDRIRGQDAGLDVIADMLKSATSGLKDPTHPLGVFLLVGPSGTGKTETAIALAEQLFGGEQALITINMSEFQERHTVSRLVGSPPGYVGYGEGGVLTEAVRRRPYSVVLLDEVEKAHLDVVNLFYQVFDKGALADGEGREVKFSDTVVILTSNLGSEEIVAALTQADAGQPTAEAIAERIRPILERHFKPALLARMTVVPYGVLTHDAMLGVVRLKLARLTSQLLASHGVPLQIDDDVIEAIAERCTRAETGARNVDFLLRKHILPRMSDLLLEATSAGRDVSKLRIGIDDQGRWSISADESGPAVIQPEASPARGAIQGGGA
ncbi:type VI secretion system ATPase TssH [Pandoraea pulmonicola]|uniref:ClpV1 family T6SS ATPase n=1 Tax=Pandoraea pulmonicola TaxID=93221 RepID=A0AAJ4Z815_PANPU|nr:type VI secretion system ATPase TssH [Pandoraea pulmonicola]AJC22334.1 ClpV1 family T6SS ATPase [Pandoraea pulmonicola]SUA88559.1 protein disaggregation chaperone [Pandoraea pulmonicola]